MLRVESRQFSATAPAVNLPHLHLAPPLGVTLFEFCRDFRHQKTRFHGLACSIVCVILRLAASVEHQFVTDGQTIPALASVSQVKILTRTEAVIQKHI